MGFVSKLSLLAALTALTSFVDASPAPGPVARTIRHSSSLSRRESGPPTLPETCTDFWLGQGVAKSTVCASIVGTNLIVEYKEVTGYTYNEAHLYIGCTKPPLDAPGSKDFNLFGSTCQVSAKGVTCTVPLTALETAPGCSTGPCDTTYVIMTHAALTLDADPLKEETGWGMGTCYDTDMSPVSTKPICGRGNGWSNYWNFKITCPPPPPPPPKELWCPLGTGFGYVSTEVSPQLDTMDPRPNSCKRWGWYIPTTISQLPITGTLIVGAGNNVLEHGEPAGSFVIKVGSEGVVDVSYDLLGGYDLAEVHVYAKCGVLPTSCAPGSYGNGPVGDLSGTSDTSLTVSFTGLATCTQTVYFIVHAKVNKLFTDIDVCPPPKEGGL